MSQRAPATLAVINRSAADDRLAHAAPGIAVFRTRAHVETKIICERSHHQHHQTPTLAGTVPKTVPKGSRRDAERPSWNSWNSWNTSHIKEVSRVRETDNYQGTSLYAR